MSLFSIISFQHIDKSREAILHESLLAALSATTFEKHKPKGIAEIVEHYKKLGVCIDMGDLEKTIATSPEFENILQSGCDYYHQLNAISGDSLLDTRELIAESAITYAVGLAITYKYAEAKDNTNFSILTLNSLACLLSQIAFVARGTQTINVPHALFVLSSMIATICKHDSFVQISALSKKAYLELSLDKLEDYFLALNACLINITSSCIKSLSGIDSNSLNSTLHKILLECQDINTELLPENMSVAKYWQQLRRITKPEATEFKISTSPANMNFSTNSIISCTDDEIIVPAKTERTPVGIPEASQLHQDLSQTHHINAASNLGILCGELSDLEHDILENKLVITPIKEKFVLPPHTSIRNLHSQSLDATLKTISVNFSEHNKGPGWIQFSLTVTTPDGATESAQVELVNSQASSQQFNVIGYGEYYLLSNDTVLIKNHPTDCNLCLMSSQNLTLENVQVRGSLVVVTKKILTNHGHTKAIAAHILARGGMINSLGSSLEFNNALTIKAKYLDNYRGSIRQTATSQKQGNVDILLSHELYNFHGEVRNNGRSRVTVGAEVDNRHGALVASDITIKSLAKVTCCDYSHITASGILRIFAAKIVKDDTSTMLGATISSLNSTEGMRFEGPIVNYKRILLQQDRGGFHYHCSRLVATNLQVISADTTNVLEKELKTSSLGVFVTNNDSYEVPLGSQINSSAITVVAPGINIDTIKTRAITAQATGSNDYTLQTTGDIRSKYVRFNAKGIRQSASSSIQCKSAVFTGHNLELSGQIRATENILLHMNGDNIRYNPATLTANNWLGLQFNKFANFVFPYHIVGSLYARVLNDSGPATLQQHLKVNKHGVLLAPNSDVTVNGVGQTLHFSFGGSVLLSTNSLSLTVTGFYSEIGTYLLAKTFIKYGEPTLITYPSYLFTSGNSVIQAGTEIQFHTGSIDSFEDSYFSAPEIKHQGTNITTLGNASYKGQPITSVVVEFYPYAVTESLPLGGLFRNEKIFSSKQSLVTPFTNIKVDKLLAVYNPLSFSGHALQLQYGSYSGAAMSLPGFPLLANFVHKQSSIGVNTRRHAFHRKTHVQYEIPCPDAAYNHYPVDAIQSSVSSRGDTAFTLQRPTDIEYNFSAGTITLELGNHTMQIGSRYSDLSRPKPFVPEENIYKVNIHRGYIKNIVTASGHVVKDIIFKVPFVRPSDKIVILTPSGATISSAANEPLSHPYIEMQHLIETIFNQLQHLRFSSIELSMRDIYELMLANAFEHATSNRNFNADSIIKPMLLYVRNPNGSLTPHSILPKILDIPELRANIGCIFCGMLKARGNADSALELAGAIVSEHGGKLDVGRLTITQKLRSSKRYLVSTSTRKKLLGKEKTRIEMQEATITEPVYGSGVMRTTNGSWDINTENFVAHGGEIVCFNGDIALRVRNKSDIYSMLATGHRIHTSKARTALVSTSISQSLVTHRVLPFRLKVPGGTVTIICDSEFHAEAMEIFAQSGYIRGDRLIDLKASTFWQDIPVTYSRHGMVLSQTSGRMQFAEPCMFFTQDEMIFETSESGKFRDQSSIIFAREIRITTGNIAIHPVELKTCLYNKSSGLRGIAAAKEKHHQMQTIDQGSSYCAYDGDIILHATDSILACAVSIEAPEGQARFVAENGEISFQQGQKKNEIHTSSKSIGVSFTLSDTIISAIRGDMAQALQALTQEVELTSRFASLATSEGSFDTGVNAIHAVDAIKRSYASLREGGLTGFLTGQLQHKVGVSFNSEKKNIKFTEIIENWLLARQVIIQAKQGINISAATVECEDLAIQSDDASIHIDGGITYREEDTVSSGLNIGATSTEAGVTPNASVSSSNTSTIGTGYGMSSFRVSNSTYISALRGNVHFRNALLQSKKAYIEALRLTLESLRDKYDTSMRGITVGTRFGISNSKKNYNWVIEQTGLDISESIEASIKIGIEMAGSYIAVKACSNSKISLPSGESLYEIIMPEDEDSAYRCVGIPKAQAISQLFASADSEEIRNMLAPEILAELLSKNLPAEIDTSVIENSLRRLTIYNVPNVFATDQLLLNHIDRMDLLDFKQHRDVILTWCRQQETFEAYVGFYLANSAQALPLGVGSFSTLSVLAKLNSISLRLWEDKGELKLAMEHLGETGKVVNVITRSDGQYNRLHSEPGLLVSSVFSYSDIISEEISNETSLSYDVAPGLFDTGGNVVSICHRRAKRKQTNYAHTSGITLEAQSGSLPTSSSNRSEEHTKKRRYQVDNALFSKALGLLTPIASIVDKINSSSQGQQLLIEEIRADIRMAAANESTPIKSVRKVMPSAHDTTTAKQTTYYKPDSFTTAWHDIDFADFDVFPQTTPEYFFDEGYQSNPQPSFMASIGESILDFFVPPAYAEDFSTPDNIVQTWKPEENIFGLTWKAITGDTSAKLRMRQRLPNVYSAWQQFDPTLRQEDADSMLMAELKMYGRSASNVRNDIVHLVTKPHEVLLDTATLLWDATGAVQQLVFNSCNSQSKIRNQQRWETIKDVWHSPPINKRELILSATTNALLFGGVSWGATRTKYLRTPVPTIDKPALLPKYSVDTYSNLSHNASVRVAFSVKSAFEGALYPKEKLTNLAQYLEKRGVYVYGTEGNPKFVGMWDGTGQIYLPENPTVLQVKHELSHYLDFKKFGVNEYVKLSRYDRERLVLERLQQNRLWSGLNDLEKKFSKNYVDSLKPKMNSMRLEYE